QRNPCGMMRVGVLILAILLLRCPTSVASTGDDLDPAVQWQTNTISITGNHDITESQIRAQLVTQKRPWYAPWRARPPFDPATFKTDIERIQRLYLANGYYEVTVTYDVAVDTQQALVSPHITIQEGAPVYVTRVTIEVTDDPTILKQLATLQSTLPLR